MSIIIKLLVTIILLNITLFGCAKNIRSKGFNFNEHIVSNLHEEVKNKDQLLSLLGSPSSTSAFGKETWYYISAKEEYIAFFKPKLIEQIIIAFEFDNNGNIVNIDHYDIKDGEYIEFIEDLTHSAGDNTSIINNVVKNIGRFNKKNMRRTGVK